MMDSKINQTLESVVDRRHFIKLAALSGISIGSLMSEPLPVHAAGHTDALLLSCMDFRLVNEIEHYMSERGLRDKYDHIVLAGASLGAITHKYRAWNKTFWQHLDTAISLHSVHTVLLLDHRDCGAYKLILGAEHTLDPKLERTTHQTQLQKLQGMIKKKHSHLHVEMLLMDLDGKVEVID